MQTQLDQAFKETAEGREADAILRSCVHCGFCNATCPTYQLLGDELDGPRGRIYLMKNMLEGQPVTRETQTHLDRCLTCLNCQSTCPSGVRYAHLLDIGRSHIERHIERTLGDRLMRWGLRRVLPYPARFAPLLGLGRALRPVLPAALRNKIPARSARRAAWPEARHERRMLILEGCVQPGLSPEINLVTARVLDRLGISLLRAQAAGCCGAVSQHLGAEEEARTFMRANIDAWWPAIEAGAEALVMTASGCGALVREYAHHLRNDPDYAEKAGRVSALTRDLSEVLQNEDLGALAPPTARRIAFHAPCSLQHAQRIRGVVEDLLARSGHELVPVQDAHLCCGSAGTYSILQSALAERLRDNKLEDLQAAKPAMIATANIGCLHHLQAGTHTPVVHWIMLMDRDPVQDSV